MEHYDFAAIEALLRRHGFHFSKSMGQNFLIDATVPAAIAEASEAGEGNGVLEIGPGIGALSHELCRRAGRVVAVELDKALLPILDETMANFDGFLTEARAAIADARTGSRELGEQAGEVRLRLEMSLTRLDNMLKQLSTLAENLSADPNQFIRGRQETPVQPE